MRNIFLVLVLCLAFEAQAQDLIVTTNNDSINAKITKENQKGLYFDFMKGSELRSTLLLHSQITSYQKDYFEVAEVPENAKKLTDYDGQRFRISSSAGFSYRLGKIQPGLDPVVRDYVRKLKTGFHWDASAHYIFSENYGVGIKYNTFKSTGSSSDIQITFQDGVIARGVSDDISIDFIGPTFLTRILSNNQRNSFVCTLGLGYLSYVNTQNAGLNFIETSGSTFGLTAELGYDIGLSKNFSVGISTTGMAGVLSKATVNENGTVRNIDLKEIQGSPESLTAYNLSIGLRLHL